MDAPDLSTLDDDAYEKLAVQHAHTTTRDDTVWALLTHPDHLPRTRDILLNAANRTANAMRRKKTERDAFHLECLARGTDGKREWFATRPEYESWRKRAGSFHQTMLQTVSDLGKLQKKANRDSNSNRAQQHRDVIRKLAVAVHRHQAMHMRSGEQPRQEDYELWQLLEKLTVPYGPDQEPTTLRSMLDFCWMDVTPVDPGEERRALLEQTMRDAPSGRSSQYTGVPRARHVGGGKDLAS